MTSRLASRLTRSFHIYSLHRKTKCEVPNQFFISDRTVTNPDEITHEFNKYFVNIGRLSSEQIIPQHTSEEYPGDKSKVLFRFTPVNEDGISNVIKKLKSKSSYGYDEISNNLIKHASSSLIKPLSLIVNQVLHIGIFPRQLKISRVKPIL